MRLIRLKIKNIASLKGAHEINFLDIQKESPLFAITGETGSGKSSILNSIGLALYGQIYKKNVQQLDVVTLGEKDGSIELIIQVKGKYYLADWKARVRKQNGELYASPQTPVRNLYVLDGDNFESSKNIASVSCAELLNLDFDQFCKCIILNQGEFAKFITSPFNERKDILEKLYPGEILDNITRELKIEKDHLEKSKNDLEIEMATLRGDNTSGEELRDKKKELQIELKSLEEISSKVEKLDYHFISLFTYHEKYIENEKKKEQIKRDIAEETRSYNSLLKTGEGIQERYLSCKKAQEQELPTLQIFLKKEETLKLFEENWASLKKRSDETQKSLALILSRIKSINEDEEKSKHKLVLQLEKLRHPLDELKKGGPHFEDIFEVFSEKELISEEIKGKTEQLSHLEISGKELKAQIQEIENKIKEIPKDIKEIEQNIQKQKDELSTRIDKKQRAEIKSQELKKQLEKSTKEKDISSERIIKLKLIIKKAEEDILPLETTLKLKEVLNATEVCLNHAITSNSNHCPVCEQEASSTKWDELKLKLEQTDLDSIRKRYDEQAQILNNSKKDEEYFENKLKAEEEASKLIMLELSEVTKLTQDDLPTLKDLDQKLEAIKKQVWGLDTLSKELQAKNTDLIKTREMYSKFKNEVNSREKLLDEKNQKLNTLASKLQTLIPEISKESIRDLKNEVRNLGHYIEAEREMEKVIKDKSHFLEQKVRLESDFSKITNEEKEQGDKIKSLKTELTDCLKGEKAHDLIQKLNQALKVATEDWNRQVEDQKKKELNLKDAQGRLYQLNELTKDYDIHFTQELHTVREHSSGLPGPQLIKLKDLDLSLTSPRELFIPLKDLLSTEKEQFKDATNQCRMKFAGISTRLDEWEKLQDKILLLELKGKDINEALSRKLRLYEVLGKDELRTFVLSLVEENLIQQTNDELQKLCHGRYEIVHQTKSMRMTPEFYILDKFREGNKRKVTTLSGGETFMVSLAMALGLAEMTRGQAEIDSLFIDEGFGTLDQESLEDVLDMLKQIQTRGLMVGIISHIKSLTTALPVNLLLNKKQDGTSTVSIQYN
jgi:DNA repair protein SbcC/Rad50